MSLHLHAAEAMGLLTAASAHGPVMSGDALHRAFDSVRSLAGQANIMSPGQELLDELIAGTLVAAEA